jgi:Porin subfamily.
MRRTTLSLVSSAAALLFVGIASANAADAIVAAPPEAPSGNYVQVCDAFGAGYFFIPGSETCLKLSGNVAVSAGWDHNRDNGYSSVEARMDIDTRADSEFGTIGTKVRLSSRGHLDRYTIGFDDVRDEGIELAYISAGPVYAGLKETLVNTDILFGDSLDLETIRGDMNSTTIGFLSDIGGGIYAGLGVEHRERGNGLKTIWYGNDNDVDIAGRFGISGQSWGQADVSALYQTETKDWFVKGTADLKATDSLDFRLAAAYGEDADNDFYLLAAAGKYAFSDKVSAFTGVSYLDRDNDDNIWTANVGAVYSLATNFDVKGEAYYSDWKADDTYGTKLTFVRSW